MFWSNHEVIFLKMAPSRQILKLKKEWVALVSLISNFLISKNRFKCFKTCFWKWKSWKSKKLRKTETRKCNFCTYDIFKSMVVVLNWSIIMTLLTCVLHSSCESYKSVNNFIKNMHWVGSFGKINWRLTIIIMEKLLKSGYIYSKSMVVFSWNF